jgi:hypothetical protein
MQRCHMHVSTLQLSLFVVSERQAVAQEPPANIQMMVAEDNSQMDHWQNQVQQIRVRKKKATLHSKQSYKVGFNLPSTRSFAGITTLKQLLLLFSAIFFFSSFIFFLSLRIKWRCLVGKGKERFKKRFKFSQFVMVNIVKFLYNVFGFGTMVARFNQCKQP